MNLDSGQKRVLVAEDEEINLVIATHILNRAGYQVVPVDNGEAAIEAIRREKFDLVLMDIEMPIMDGLEAIPHIRELPNGSTIPIVALTAHSLPEKLQQIQEVGGNDYLLKPFDEDKLQQIIDRYL
ncbi:MAG: response regulator [Bacteroidota bacterium]